MNTTKMPVVLFLKNKPTIITIAAIGDNKSHEEFDDMVLDQLPEGITRNDVVRIACFCEMCQAQYSIDLNIVMSQLAQLIEQFPPEALLKFVGLQNEDYSALTIGWTFFAQLVHGQVAIHPFLIKAKEEAEAWQESVNKG